MNTIDPKIPQAPEESLELEESKKSVFQKPLIVTLAALCCCALWGSAIPVIKVGYGALQIAGSDTASQILFAGLRFLFAGVLTIIFGSILKHKFITPESHAWNGIVTLGIVETVVQYLFFYVALSNTTSVKTSILTSSSVFMAFLIGSLILHYEKLTAIKLFGCLLGFMGVIIVNLDGGIDSSFKFTGEGFVLLSSAANAMASNMTKAITKKQDPLILSAYHYVVGGLILIAIGLMRGGSVYPTDITGVLVLLYLPILSAVAYGLWSFLLKHNPLSKITVYSFTIPIFGVAFSILMLHESFSFSQILISLILTSISVIIINRQPTA